MFPRKRDFSYFEGEKGVRMSLIAYHHAEQPPVLNGTELDRRLAQGWFRMHQEIFTTTHLFTHDDIHRVHWLRYPVADIKERASHRRMRKKHAGFRVSIDDFAGIPGDHEVLFAKYRAAIDFEGADSVEHALFGDEPGRQNIFHTKVISLFDKDRLVAGGYFDLGEAAGTSILHFFDPEYKTFSLGRYMILLTVDFLRDHGYAWYYPGYVVSGRPKMNYKLFLGRDMAQYFHAPSAMWRPFEESILGPERLTEADKLQIALAFME